jgi:hypothetical protein
MFKHNLLCAAFAAAALLVGCKNDTPAKAPAPVEEPAAAGGTFCFFKAMNRDTTAITLTIAGTEVSGQMMWRPWEKDGAVGTLKGTRNANGEMDLLYSYVIEGSNQTETKVMKIENGKLLIKEGELEDPKFDGNLRYKDVTKATFSEVLDKVNCH